MPDLVISSLRGGMNNTDPPTAIPDDQSTLAQNVEYVSSMLGERRMGTIAIDLTGSGLTGHDRITFLYRHLPTAVETVSQLWALGVTGAASSTLAYKEGSVWTTPTLKDAFVLTGTYPNKVEAQTHGGKLFIAYKSAVDRLHVFDGSTVRRTGLAEPGVPSVADTGSAGSYATKRYFRVRVIEKSGSTIVRRSEPSVAVSITPLGTKDGVTVTRGTVPGEGETHWEVEESLDNANFYRTAEVAIGTTASIDTTVSTSVTSGTLSDDIGDYALIPSPKYLALDDDRLIWAGSHEVADYASRLGWTVVLGDLTGVGNNERFATDTDPYKDLDRSEGGGITGLSRPVNGSFYVFKFSQIHKAVRSGKRNAAYDTIALTKQVGAVDGSVVDAVDQNGMPCVYFIDPRMGPMRLGAGGLRQCGMDVRASWAALNVTATGVACDGVYYPYKQQVIWRLAVDSNNPSIAIVLHTRFTRNELDGVRRGWTTFTGPHATALCSCLYADNIDIGGPDRTLKLVPLLGMSVGAFPPPGSALVQRSESEVLDDNGVPYAARVVSKPYTAASVLRRFAVRAGAVIAKAVTGALVSIKLTRDLGLETQSVNSVSLAATSTETEVIKDLDNLRLSDLRVVQIEIADPDTPGTKQWQVNQIALSETGGQSA